MNLATIEAIRQGISEIARQAETGWHGDDYSNGAADLHRRVDNYLCELIVEHGGEVKEPQVLRYIEVRKIVGLGLYDPVHREKAQEPGNMLMWMRRIKELEAQVDCKTHFVTVCEYDSEQLLIDHFLETDKEPGQEIPWDDLPDWVQWVAMDADKDWFQYENKPILQGDCEWWFDSKNTLKTGQRPVKTKKIPFTAPDWRTSLRQRPKTNEQC